MTVRLRMNDRGAVSRMIVGDVVTEIDSGDFLWLPVNAERPDQMPGPSDSSPRDSERWVLEYADGYRYPGDLHTGDRVTLSTGRVLELLEEPSAYMEVERITGWVVFAQDVETLYPLTGTLTDPDGNVLGEVPIALWNETEVQERMGRFENFDAEMPLVEGVELHVNIQLTIDGDIYKITEAVRSQAAPRWLLRLRKQNSG